MIKKTILVGSLFTTALMLLIPSITAVEGTLAQQAAPQITMDPEIEHILNDEKNNQEEPQIITTLLILLLKLLRRGMKAFSRVLKLVRLFGWAAKGLILLLLLGRISNNSTMAV